MKGGLTMNKIGLNVAVLSAMAGLAIGGCAPGRISGHQVVVRREVLAPGANAQVVVECPTGKKVTGGGFSIETPDDVKVFASAPSDGQGNVSDHAWEVHARNSGSASRQVTAMAVCVSAE